MGGSPWTWVFPDVKAPVFHLTEQDGSGAVQVFQALRRSREHLAIFRGVYKSHLPDVYGWYNPESDFSCGSCYLAAQNAGHVFISGGRFPSHRSDAVIYHELGHFAFEVLGGLSSEAGQHCFGAPTLPGVAFSEGHAYWYSADRRRSGLLFIEVDGIFHDWDLDALTPAESFGTPIPSAGPAQPLNESWVGAALWHLGKAYGESMAMHHAISLPEMQAPVASGYTARIWTQVDDACLPVDPQDSGHPTPILSDYLDALVCGGVPPEPIQEIISEHYPYDPFNPNCKD